MFLTAIRIGLRAAETTDAKQIYLVGFDFSLTRGFSRKIDPHASGSTQSEQHHRIELQEQIFLAAQKLLQGGSTQLVHVGYKTFSRLTPGAFSERNLATEQVVNDNRSRGNKVLITAELTTNHLGDLDRAKDIIRHAAQQGADLVKFQMRHVDSFYKPDVLGSSYPSPFGNTFGDYRQGLELSDSDFEAISLLTGEIGIGWFASVLDEKSLERAIRLAMPMIKLPGTISRRRDFLAKVAREFQGDLVFSTGMTSPEYVDWILRTFGNERRIYLLHTNSAYPTPTEDCNISVVSNYARLAEENPNLIPGYSSHDEGWLGSALAVACGAQMIEKHVKLGSSDWMHFDSVALDLGTSQFSEFVQAIRRTELTLGDPQKKLTPSEHHKY